MSEQYIDRKAVKDSYRPGSGLMSPGLKRAREPYRIRNAITGLGLGAFAVGIWAYSISAVKQDVFDDIDEEARAIARTGAPTEVLSVKDEKRTMEAAIAKTASPSSAQLNSQLPSSQPTDLSRNTVPNRGILQNLDTKFPWLLDPQQKTLVWGAPSIDNIGKMSKS